MLIHHSTHSVFWHLLSSLRGILHRLLFNQICVLQFFITFLRILKWTVLLKMSYLITIIATYLGHTLKRSCLRRGGSLLLHIHHGLTFGALTSRLLTLSWGIPKFHRDDLWSIIIILFLLLGCLGPVESKGSCIKSYVFGCKRKLLRVT